MKAEILDRIPDVGATAAQLEAELGRLKEAVVDAVEDGVSAAKQAVKKGRRTAVDLIDDAEYQVKRRPLNALGVSFGIGLGLGAMVGVLLFRKGRCGG